MCALLLLALAGCNTTPKAPESAATQTLAPVVTKVETTPEVKPAPAPVKKELDRVESLIAKVESAYAKGQADYKKGRLVEAKSEFDRAVDLMLLSGYDLRANPALQEEFDKIIDGVNGLEMEALKQGNGFVTKEEETPAEVAGDVTFAVDPEILAKAKEVAANTKSDLPLVVNDYVAAYINFFANTKRGHNTLLHSLQRAGRYRAMIQRAMAEEGVPQDLIYLAVAESSFNPRAMNPHSHAGGMWQFMPNDSFYGLKRTQWVDERFDPEKSTRAYARYMKYIYNQLGDWYLSMAAFNWGTGNVQRAVQKTGYADFWELYRRNNLPGETKTYVPEILASIIIANNLSQYGFDDLASDLPVLTDTVTINYQVDLKLAGEIVGAPQEEMVALNPSLLRGVTPPEGPFDLHLPAGTATLFEQRIAVIPESKRNSWRYHRVSAGETLAEVARQFHMSESQLAEANQLQEGASLEKVEGLAIPQASHASADVQRSTMYTARKGDTLVTIADRYGVSIDQLRRWNDLSGTKVAAGTRLHISEPAAGGSTAKSSRHGKKQSDAAEESSDKSQSKATRTCTGHGKKRHCTVAPEEKSDNSRAEKSSEKSNGKNAKSAGKNGEKSAKSAEARSTERSEKSAERSAKKAERSTESETSKSAETKSAGKKSRHESAGAKSDEKKKSNGKTASTGSRKNSRKEK